MGVTDAKVVEAPEAGGVGALLEADERPVDLPDPAPRLHPAVERRTRREHELHVTRVRPVDVKVPRKRSQNSPGSLGSIFH